MLADRINIWYNQINPGGGILKMGMTEKIKILLIKRGLTQKELADKLGISQPVLSKKYKLDNWREDDLNKIAEVLQADFEGSFVLKDTKERI